MKPRMTFEEHVEMGLGLARLRDELVHRTVQLSNAYPKSGPESVPAQRLEKALNAIDKARSELEDMLYGEHQEQAGTSVYYPQRENRR
ncbi:hypothetical protein ACFY9C_35235 [Streptomyces filamentosus]|uniref:hypothetical protein n=1 Tax=Streptomyces filamentosus TaxID=67294 RepID=UPI0036E9E39E